MFVDSGSLAGSVPFLFTFILDPISVCVCVRENFSFSSPNNRLRKFIFIHLIQLQALSETAFEWHHPVCHCTVPKEKKNIKNSPLYTKKTAINKVKIEFAQMHGTHTYTHRTKSWAYTFRVTNLIMYTQKTSENVYIFCHVLELQYENHFAPILTVICKSLAIKRMCFILLLLLSNIIKIFIFSFF